MSYVYTHTYIYIYIILTSIIVADYISGKYDQYRNINIFSLYNNINTTTELPHVNK